MAPDQDEGLDLSANHGTGNTRELLIVCVPSESVGVVLDSNTF